MKRVDNGVDKEHALIDGAGTGPPLNVPLELVATAIEVAVLPAAVPGAGSHTPVARGTRDRVIDGVVTCADLELDATRRASNSPVRYEHHVSQPLPEAPADIVEQFVVNKAEGVGLVQPNELVGRQHGSPSDPL